MGIEHLSKRLQPFPDGETGRDQGVRIKMSDQTDKVIEAMVKERSDGWDGFMSFSKISIVGIFIVLIILALVTL